MLVRYPFSHWWRWHVVPHCATKPGVCTHRRCVDKVVQFGRITALRRRRYHALMLGPPFVAGGLVPRRRWRDMPRIIIVPPPSLPLSPPPPPRCPPVVMHPPAAHSRRRRSSRARGGTTQRCYATCQLYRNLFRHQFLSEEYCAWTILLELIDLHDFWLCMSIASDSFVWLLLSSSICLVQPFLASSKLSLPDTESSKECWRFGIVRGADNDADEVVTRIVRALGESQRLVIDNAISTSFFDKIISRSLRLNLYPSSSILSVLACAQNSCLRQSPTPALVDGSFSSNLPRRSLKPSDRHSSPA